MVTRAASVPCAGLPPAPASPAVGSGAGLTRTRARGARMRWVRVLWLVSWATVAAAGLPGAARAGDAPAASASPIDDTGRLYLWFESGINLTLDRDFAGDARVVPNSDVEFVLGGGAGYNIDPHWGVELQVDGTDPWVRSETRGGLERIAVITVVPAVRYRWALGDGRLM